VRGELLVNYGHEKDRMPRGHIGIWSEANHTSLSEPLLETCKAVDIARGACLRLDPFDDLLGKLLV
jgi:hypothetical protein